MGGAELRKRLVWLILFRTVATSLSLAVTVARLLMQPLAEPTRAETFSFGVIAVAYVSTLVSGLRLRRGKARRRDAAVQVLGDVAIATGLVFLNGGAESPFTFVYSLAVIGAAIVLDWRGALWAASASVLAFGAVVGFAHFGWTPGPDGMVVLSPSRALFLLGSNTLALGLIAVLSGYLSRQLTVAGGALSAREADLQRLGRIQQQIVASMPSGLVTCDSARRVTFVNAAAESMLHLEPGAVVGTPLERLLPGIEAFAPRATRGELALDTAKGRRVLGLSVTPLERDVGALLVVFQDLTELRRMEQDLRRADRLASLGTLSAQLAHEIRNPLAAMRGSAQLLAQDGATSPTSQKLSQIVLREADRLGRLVEEFLTFARPAEPARREVALEALVAETVDMMRVDPLARDVAIELSLPEPLRCQVDPDQLRQVLLNLLRNAFQAAGAGGTVRVGLARAGAELQLRVWDGAGGIAPEQMGRLFEPFYTTRNGGTGLGLSTAHSIVRAHGGNIRVSSSPGEGTEFVVSLPL